MPGNIENLKYQMEVFMKPSLLVIYRSRAR